MHETMVSVRVMSSATAEANSRVAYPVESTSPARIYTATQPWIAGLTRIGAETDPSDT